MAALRWVGGKSVLSSTGLGKWIAAMLPTDASVYCEPFAGMLGILLQRSAAPVEIVNDRDGRVINWWRCIRDRPDELRRLITNTPFSRAEYDAAWERLTDGHKPDGLGDALDFTVAVGQSILPTIASWQPPWASTWYPTDWRSSIDYRIEGLAKRLRNVHLERCDACDLLDRLADNDKALIYVDPPYPSAKEGIYAEGVDFDRLADALKKQKGRVALSGYTGEWDHLGWDVHKKDIRGTLPGENKVNNRQEALWLNYEPPRLL